MVDHGFHSIGSKRASGLADETEWVHARETIDNVTGNVQSPDLSLELDSATNFAEALLASASK